MRLYTERRGTGNTNPQLIDATGVSVCVGWLLWWQGLVRGDVIILGAAEGAHTSEDSWKVPTDSGVSEASRFRQTPSSLSVQKTSRCACSACVQSHPWQMDRSDLIGGLGVIQGSVASTNDDALKSGNTGEQLIFREMNGWLSFPGDQGGVWDGQGCGGSRWHPDAMVQAQI